MTIDQIREVFMWCTVINGILFFFSFIMLTLFHNIAYRIHGTLFRLSKEKFDEHIYSGMIVFKLILIIFNVVPFIALSLVR